MEQNWKELLKNSVRDVKGIREFLTLDDEEAKDMEAIVEKYPLCVNSYYLSLIDKNDPNDPIRKICIPDTHEFSVGGQADTSGELDNTVVQGMQHKYKQTALILSTNQCAMYCRFCFRKRLVGAASNEIAKQLTDMTNYVREHKETNNVIISGGDALLNSNQIIKEYLCQFGEIPTLDYIRFGTRIPVVLPQRITEDQELLDILEEYGKKKQIFIITHFNHPKEITPEAVKAIQMLQKVGCVVRNQTVLLKGVNDKAEILSELLNRLVYYGVIPYYIFQCRPVIGVKNQFQIPFTEGIEIVEKAKTQMSGQAKSVRYVLSHPTGKIEIMGKADDHKMIFKYHQAKYDKDEGRIFMVNVDNTQCWLDEKID